ncbi:MAG: cytochrome c oxidase subunit II [Anaerolineales bacterium]
MGGLLDNASTFGPEVDALFMVVLVITGIAFVLVEGLLIYFLIRYRGRPGQKAAFVHGHQRLEQFWTVGTGLALLSLALYQRGTWDTIKQQLPDENTAVVIGLSAKQFEWHATYPGADGRLDPNWHTAEQALGDDIKAPINILHLPVGQPIIFRLTAQDVLHSFFIPQFRLKQDAVPGQTIRVWVQATHTGQFEIACAELCGLGHYRMRGQVTVETPQEFEAWLAEVKAQTQGN